MKNKLKISALALFASIMLAAAQNPTPFSFSFVSANGQPDTNQTLMQGWPPASGSVTVVSNVIVFSGASQIITNTFTNGLTIGTNAAMPNNYRVLRPSDGLAFFVTIPQTTNVLPLATYVTGAPVTYPSSSLYFYITNALGFQPLASNTAAILGGLGFQPVTNTFSGITNALGYFPATNIAGITTNVAYLDGKTNVGTLYFTNSQLMKVNAP